MRPFAFTCKRRGVAPFSSSCLTEPFPTQVRRNIAARKEGGSPVGAVADGAANLKLPDGFEEAGDSDGEGPTTDSPTAEGKKKGRCSQQ